MFKKNNFHWLFTTVVYQEIENSERANQIHRCTIDDCKFILISNRPQTMSKCGKNKNVAHKMIAECVTDIFTTF